MDLQKHNLDYKLISVFINGKELVYGEYNSGDNPGLEVYHYKTPVQIDDHFYYSRRYAADNIPGIYSFLYRRLKALIAYCPAGQKLTLTNTEYHDIANLQGRYKQAV